jgi:hypothetical protein
MVANYDEKIIKVSGMLKPNYRENLTATFTNLNFNKLQTFKYFVEMESVHSTRLPSISFQDITTHY